jgi:pimeloyl-ACP methyl ester carboxylesterase
MRDEMKPHYLADGSRRTAVLELVLEMALDQGEGVFIRQSRALQTRPDQQDTLRAVQVPTLVLCGAEDSLCPLERHTLMAELIPDAELVVVENAGHLPTLEQPEAVTRAMTAWLAR